MPTNYANFDYPIPEWTTVKLTPTGRIRKANGVTLEFNRFSDPVFYQLDSSKYSTFAIRFNDGNFSGQPKPYLSQGFLSSQSPGVDPLLATSYNASKNWYLDNGNNGFFYTDSLYSLGKSELGEGGGIAFDFIETTDTVTVTKTVQFTTWIVEGKIIWENSGLGDDIQVLVYDSALLPEYQFQSGGGWWQEYGDFGWEPLRRWSQSPYGDIWLMYSSITEISAGTQYEEGVTNRSTEGKVYIKYDSESALIYEGIIRNISGDTDLYRYQCLPQIAQWGLCGHDLTNIPKSVLINGIDFDGFYSWRNGSYWDSEKYNQNKTFKDYFHSYSEGQSSSYCPDCKACCCDDVMNGRYAELITEAGQLIRPTGDL